jgi:hypothetical protein
LTCRAGARARRVLIAALLAAAVLPGAAYGAAGFGLPFAIVAPDGNDLLGAQLAFAPDNSVAAAFGIDNEDVSAGSSALPTQGSGATFLPPRRISAAQQVLALTYDGPALELLMGNSPSGQPCCSAVLAAPVTGRQVGVRHTLISGLTGTADAQLLPDQSRLVAAVAGEHGVWVAQTDTRGRWGPTRSIDVRGGWPQELAATALTGGRTIVVWTARTSQFAPGPTGIYLAAGDPGGAPSHPHVTLAVPAGHMIDELQLAARGTFPTVAWIESWYDSSGEFHSQAYAEDLTGARKQQTLSSPSLLASGLALASAPTGATGATGPKGSSGAQAVAFRTCASDGACVVHAAVRRSHGFGSFATLGPIDASQTPVVAAGRDGAALVGWIANGGVMASVASPAAGAFASPVTVSPTTYASDLALGFDQAGAAGLLAWTQGTVNQSVVGARYTAP